jgi:hypothetical protein
MRKPRPGPKAKGARKARAGRRSAAELPHWSVYRLRKPPLAFIGFVRAADAADAIAVALENYAVPENWRDRLIALREPSCLVSQFELWRAQLVVIVEIADFAY